MTYGTTIESLRGYPSSYSMKGHLHESLYLIKWVSGGDLTWIFEQNRKEAKMESVIQKAIKNQGGSNLKKSPEDQNIDFLLSLWGNIIYIVDQRMELQYKNDVVELTLISAFKGDISVN